MFEPVEPDTAGRRRRAVMYLRVSTGAQAQGASIGIQREQCQAAAELHGLTLVREYVDAGVSGARAARPALDELTAAATAGGFDALLVAKLDRLGRNLLHLLTLMQELDALGIRVICVGDGLDTRTPAGRLMLQLLGVFAEFERERIRERSHDGVRHRVTDGGFVESVPPFGYRPVPDPHTGRGVVLDIDPAQAARIRQMYRLLVVDRVPVTRAAQALNDAGHRTATGAAWTQLTLSRWARGNGPITAAGTWRWNELTVPIPPILTPRELHAWAAWKNDTRLPQQPPSRYLLSGRVHTPCGGRYHGRTAGTQTPVYTCKNRLTTRADDPARCHCRPIPVDTLDEAVWTRVSAALTDPTRLDELTTPAAGPTVPDIGVDTLATTITEIAEAISQLKHEIAAEYQAARADGFDAATARLMVQPWQADLADAQRNLDRLTAVRAALTRQHADAGTGADSSTDNPPERLPDPRAGAALDNPAKQVVLDVLGVTVHVTGYDTCPTCHGTGYQPIPPGYGRHRPPGCPTCHRLHEIPHFTVHITRPHTARTTRTAPKSRPAAG
jgi:DNA invertase Pin-like site-specific DNA recombinase